MSPKGIQSGPLFSLMTTLLKSIFKTNTFDVMTYTFVHPIPNTITFNIPNGPADVELVLISQWTNKSEVTSTATGLGQWQTIAQQWQNIIAQWQGSGVSYNGVPFALLTTNDRYSEYEASLDPLMQQLSEAQIEGIFNYKVLNKLNAEELDRGTIKIKNESQDNWPTPYISTNETREGVVFAPNNL